MKNLLVLTALSACAVDPEIDETEQAIASTAAVRICRTDTPDGYFANLTLQGVEFYGGQPEDFDYSWWYWGVGWANVASATTDCSGNLSMTARFQPFYVTGLRVHELSTDTYIYTSLPANGACVYTGGYSASTWSYPLTSCGGSSGGGGSAGGGGSHLLM